MWQYSHCRKASEAIFENWPPSQIQHLHLWSTQNLKECSMRNWLLQTWISWHQLFHQSFLCQWEPHMMVYIQKLKWNFIAFIALNKRLKYSHHLLCYPGVRYESDWGEIDQRQVQEAESYCLDFLLLVMTICYQKVSDSTRKLKCGMNFYDSMRNLWSAFQH